MLASFSVKNFKSYAEATLPLAPLTLLVGANASGKSNLIEAMQLLAWLSHGRRLADLSSAMKSGELSIRGLPAELPLDPEARVMLGCDLGGAEPLLETRLRMDGNAPRIVNELVVDGDRRTTLPLYSVVAAAAPGGSEVIVEYNNYARGGNKPRIRCADQQAIFTQLLTPARFEHARAQDLIPAACKALQANLSSTLFLDPDPKQMRGWAYRDESDLRGNGSNVSATLHKLREDGQEGDVLTFVRKLPEHDIAGIDFLTTQRNEVMVALTETFGPTSRARDAGVLSDGTLRVLAIAAAVLSVKEGSLVVIEEIDNGVHPGRAQMLLEAIHAVATRRKLHVLLTTHNPALADATPPEAIPHVVAAYRDPATGHSRLQRLADLDDYAALVAQGPLGFLMRSGTLDRYLKSRPSAEERKRQGQAAVELFRRASE